MIRLKLKKRSPDDPIYKEGDELHRAWVEFIRAVAKVLYIDRFVEWLNKKLTTKE